MTETPYILAALPQLEDDEFARAVIVVIQHDEEGAFGFLLNKPFVNQDEVATQLVAEIQDAEGSTLLEFEEPLFKGGPVKEEMVFMMHTSAEHGDEEGEIVDGIWITADTEVFQDILTREDGIPRHSFFLGCTSWEKEQLEDEIRNGAWIMIPFEAKHLFQVPPEDSDLWSEEMWKDVLRSAGVDPLTLMTQGQNDFGPN
ncbi:MAG: YqgE/AlgH family protein [Bdellovibrionota bacterium]